MPDRRKFLIFSVMASGKFMALFDVQIVSVGFGIFLGKQRAITPATLGTISVIAPTLGHTVCGLITNKLDWAQFEAMAVILGGTEFVLEEGPHRDWLGDPAIAIMGLRWSASRCFWSGRAGCHIRWSA